MDEKLEIITKDGEKIQVSVYGIVELEKGTYAVMGADDNSNEVFVTKISDIPDSSYVTFDLVNDQNIIDRVIEIFKKNQESEIL